jgi:transcriptional antiterminator RfaH
MIDRPVPPDLLPLPPWRCVRTKPKSEHLASTHLSRDGFLSYAPRIRFQKMTRRGKIWFTEALFPGYVFARFAKEEARMIKSVPCVTGLLEFTEDWGQIDDLIISDLRISFPDDSALEVRPSLEIGQEVQLVDGALSGTAAVVTRILPGQERVRILFDFLGSKRETEVSLSALLGFENPREKIFATLSVGS